MPDRRPPVRWVLDGDEVIDPAGRVRPLDLALPGRANRSNAVIALAVAEVFGVGAGAGAGRGCAGASVAGRYTQVERHGRRSGCCWPRTRPAGWRRFDVLAERRCPSLLSVNARDPDGKDTSWLWDVDYRALRGRPVFVAGERRLDLAVRLEVDEVAFRMAGRRRRGGRTAGRAARLDVIANYTAFQQIRAALGGSAEGGR